MSPELEQFLLTDVDVELMRLRALVKHRGRCRFTKQRRSLGMQISHARRGLISGGFDAVRLALLVEEWDARPYCTCCGRRHFPKGQFGG